MKNINLTESQLMIGFIAGILGLFIFPIVKTFLLWVATKLLKFEKQSFKTSLYCVLIAFGCVIVINTIFAMLFLDQIRENASLIGFLDITIGITAEIIAVKKLFKVSLWKSISATFISLIGEFMILLVFGIIIGFFVVKYK